MNECQTTPADTQRRFNVFKTSILRCQRRIHVLQTLIRCLVSTVEEQVSRSVLYQTNP